MIGNLVSIFRQKIKLGSAVAYDTDAQAYFTANTAITSAADKNAINTFYLGLKSDGIYTKLVAMYLPLWSSATSNKWNLINNRSFDLSFFTGVTHSSSGITSNGTSGYASTNLTPSTSLSLNNTHISIYSRTNNDANAVDMGASILSGTAQYLGFYLRTGNNAYYMCNVAQSGVASTANSNTNSTGYYIANRTASNVINGFKNGSKTLNTTTSSGVSINIPLFIMSLNNAGSPSFYTTRQYSFISIGNGLTDTDASNLSNRVNTLMTYFGINTY